MTHITYYKAEIYLLKTCYIQGIHQKQTVSYLKNHLQIDIYYYITLQNTCLATFTPYINLKKFCLRCVYSQVYTKSKVNLIILTVKTLAEPVIKTLVLDLDYVKSI
jgi:hypothetical protein